jgi:hypothetical protein
MSVSTAMPIVATKATPTPRFLGVLRGEIFKLARQRTVWLMLIALAGFICLPWLFTLIAPHMKTGLQQYPLYALYQDTEIALAITIGALLLNILLALIVAC